MEFIGIKVVKGVNILTTHLRAEPMLTENLHNIVIAVYLFEMFS